MTVALDIIGISIQLVSTFLAALAYVLQKKAHIRFSTSGVDAWSAPANKAAYRLWKIGFVLMVVCALLDLATYPMLDLSKQAPLGAATLVFNSILASILLSEPFTVLDLISTIMIGSGTITAVANSEAESASFTFAGILDLLDDSLVKWYSGFVVPGLLISAVFIERVSRTSPGNWSRSQARAMALLSPAAGGMFMGFTAYFAKSLSTVATGGEWFEFKNPILYLYAVLAAVSVSGQLRYLNKGLAFFDALQVVPIFQCFIIFSNALAGIVYFHDMRTAAAYKLILFAVGGGVCIAGIALLLLKKTSSAAHTSDVAATVVAAATQDVESNPLAKGASRRGSVEMHGHMGGSAPGLPGAVGDGSAGAAAGAGTPGYRMTESGVSNPAEADLMSALQRRIWAAQAQAKAAVMGVMGTAPYQPANGGGAAPAGVAGDAAAGGAGGVGADGSGAGGSGGDGADGIRNSSSGSFGSALRRIANAPFAMVTGSGSGSSAGTAGAAGTAAGAGAVPTNGSGSGPGSGANMTRRLSSRSRAGSLAASALAAFSHAISSSDVIAAASAHETVALAAGTGTGTGAAGGGSGDGASGGSLGLGLGLGVGAASPGAGPAASPEGGPSPSPRSTGAAADGSGAGAPAPLRLRGRSRGPSLAPVDEEEAGAASAAATPAVGMGTGLGLGLGMGMGMGLGLGPSAAASAASMSVESIAASAAAAFAGSGHANAGSGGNDGRSLLGSSGRGYPSYGSAGRGSFADSVGSGGGSGAAAGTATTASGAAEGDPWSASGAIARSGAPLGSLSPGHGSASSGAGAFGWSDPALPGSASSGSGAGVRQGPPSSLPPPPPHAGAGGRSSSAGLAAPLAWHEVEVKDIAKALWRRFGPAAKMARRGSYTEMDGGPPLTAGAAAK